MRCEKPGFSPWAGKIPWRRAVQPTPVVLPGDSHGPRSLTGCSPQGHKESDTTEHSTTQLLTTKISLSDSMSVIISVHKWNYQYLSPCDWFILLSIVSSKFPAFSHISGFSFSFLKIWIVSYFVYLFYIFPYFFIHWWTISASWLLWTVHSNEEWSVNNPWDLDLKYFAKIYWSEIAKSYGSSIFNFFVESPCCFP